MKSTAPHNNVHYLVENNARLNEIAARTAIVSLHPDETRPIDIMISGPCPLCHGGTVHIEPIELLRNHRPGARGPGGGKQQIEVICACGVVHPDAPNAKTGCGRSWTLIVEWDGL